MTDESERRSDFYSVKYSSFGSEAAVVLRREIFGGDIGQEGWSTVAEHAEIVELLGVGRQSHVLDVCCGSRGPQLRRKGNINAKGERIYHAPWSRHYTRRALSREQLAMAFTFGTRVGAPLWIRRTCRWSK